MKQNEIVAHPQLHNTISVQTMIERKNAEEIQYSVARRYKAFDAAQFCVFAEDKDNKNWECANCGRKIAKKVTFGNKPIVVCARPDTSLAARKENLLKVAPIPKKDEKVVKRRHYTEPTFGVGFELKKILAKLKIELPPNCTCNSRVALLNDVGIDEAEQMRDKVMVWFEDEAHKRAIYFDHAKANKVLDIAIRRAKKAALKEIKKNAENAE